MLEGGKSFRLQFLEGALIEPREGVTLRSISTHGTNVTIEYETYDGVSGTLKVNNTRESGARVNGKIMPIEQSHRVAGFGSVFVNRRNSLDIAQPDGTSRGPLQTPTPLAY